MLHSAPLQAPSQRCRKSRCSMPFFPAAWKRAYLSEPRRIPEKTSEDFVNDADIKKAGDQLNSRLGANSVVVAQVVGKKLASGTRESVQVFPASPPPADLKQTTSSDAGPKHPRGGTTTSLCS